MALCESASAGTCTFVVPGDPEQATGGYRYVKRVAETLADSGWQVNRPGLDGDFPVPDATAHLSMDRTLSQLAGGSLVVLDGLAMGAMPKTLERHAGRLNLISLVHHPLADETGLGPEQRNQLFELEKQALAQVRAVVATSWHTARRLADFGVPASKVTVVEPGVDRLWPQTPVRDYRPGTWFSILCVAHLSPRKAQTDLLAALAGLKNLDWHLTLAGSAERDPEYGAVVRNQCRELGLEQRVTLAGEVTGETLTSLYEQAHLFVLPSRHEGYGMVVDEALAAGLPIICSDGGALAETGHRAGVCLYPAGQTESLRGCLAEWLDNPGALQQASRQAAESAGSLRTWQQAAQEMAAMLGALQAPSGNSHFESGWLSLREPADHQSRSPELTRLLDRWLEHQYLHREGADRGRPIKVADLGCGAGSNLRYLVPRLSVPQEWLLLDHDESLLREAEKRARGQEVTADTRLINLTADALPEAIPDNTDLITASALIDLVSGDWLQALARCTSGIEAAMLVTLSFNGEMRLVPEDHRDSMVREAFLAHQRRNKGLGGAMGPEAAVRLDTLMRQRGYHVHTADADWALGPPQARLQQALLDGWQHAAMEQAPEHEQDIRAWFAERWKQAEQGLLTVHVGHTDLLALPFSPDVAGD